VARAQLPTSLASLDDAAFRAVRGSLRSEPLIGAIRAFSATGEHAALWLALGAAGMALDRPRRARWRRATAIVAGTYVLNTAIKLAVRRHRPVVDGLAPLISTPTQLSFPSAHAASSFAAAAAFGDLVPRGPLLAVAAGFALSRVALGVHYPSDVVAGALLGTGVAAIFRRP
jgi:membrane-associated phospholipid phosphatase